MQCQTAALPVKGAAVLLCLESRPHPGSALPLVRAGHDVIACAETGTGKTAAFVLPILEHLRQAPAPAPPPGSVGAPAGPRTRALILTPTRELAVQIDDDVQGFGYHAGIGSMAVYGGAPMEPQSRALTAGVPIVVATPGRLMDHLNAGTASFGSLDVLVIDEADRLLDMGFWPDVRRIVDGLPQARQTLLFSATMPDEVLGFAKALMRDPVFLQVGRRNAAARTITHTVLAACLFALVQLYIARGAASSYDVHPMANAIREMQDRGVPVANDGRYHAQFHFAGRLKQPLVQMDLNEMPAWFEQHPDGVAVVYISRKRAMPESLFSQAVSR